VGCRWSRRERWPNRGSGSGSSIHSYMLLAGFDTDTVDVYCQYAFVWHVDPGKEKMLTASSTFGTLTFIYWGLLSIKLKILPHGRGLVLYYQMTGVEPTLVRFNMILTLPHPLTHRQVGFHVNDSYPPAKSNQCLLLVDYSSLELSESLASTPIKDDNCGCVKPCLGLPTFASAKHEQ
jgi:hypothetical protein